MGSRLGIFCTRHRYWRDLPRQTMLPACDVIAERLPEEEVLAYLDVLAFDCPDGEWTFETKVWPLTGHMLLGDVRSIRGCLFTTR